MSSFRQIISRLFGRLPDVETDVKPAGRGAVDHVVIMDGTLSTLRAGRATNVGQIYQILQELPGTERPSLRYEPGVQWHNWRSARDVIEGRGINRQIRHAYGYLASRYRPGDRIFLFGYSRGAFAVRSLAGVIDQVGLLRADMATVRNIRTAYRLYQGPPGTQSVRDFSHEFCHETVEIQMVGVFDTVKALGWRLPFLWRFTERRHAFHNHHLGHTTRHGYHALAMDETRQAYAPVQWECPPGWEGHIQQMWFRGVHADIGGQLGDFTAARPLANIPLVWMLERAEELGLMLPENWRDRFPCDVTAPSIGSTRGWGKFFLARRARLIGRDRSERIHNSVPEIQGSALQAMGDTFPPIPKDAP